MGVKDTLSIPFGCGAAWRPNLLVSSPGWGVQCDISFLVYPKLDKGVGFTINGGYENIERKIISSGSGDGTGSETTLGNASFGMTKVKRSPLGSSIHWSSEKISSQLIGLSFMSNNTPGGTIAGEEVSSNNTQTTSLLLSSSSSPLALEYRADNRFLFRVSLGLNTEIAYNGPGSEANSLGISVFLMLDIGLADKIKTKAEIQAEDPIDKSKLTKLEIAQMLWQMPYEIIFSALMGNILSDQQEKISGLTEGSSDSTGISSILPPLNTLSTFLGVMGTAARNEDFASIDSLWKIAHIVAAVVHGGVLMGSAPKSAGATSGVAQFANALNMGLMFPFKIASPSSRNELGDKVDKKIAEWAITSSAIDWALFLGGMLLANSNNDTGVKIANAATTDLAAIAFSPSPTAEKEGIANNSFGYVLGYSWQDGKGGLLGGAQILNRLKKWHLYTKVTALSPLASVTALPSFFDKDAKFDNLNLYSQIASSLGLYFDNSTIGFSLGVVNAWLLGKDTRVAAGGEADIYFKFGKNRFFSFGASCSVLGVVPNHDPRYVAFCGGFLGGGKNRSTIQPVSNEVHGD